MTNIVDANWRRLGTIASLAMLCMSIGCRSTNNDRTILAKDLPIEFRASNQAPNPQLDLSFLASRSINTDLIYPGDVLEVAVITGAEETPPDPLPYRVSPNGTLDLPILGSVPVSGLSLTGAEERLQQHAIANRIYRDPKISVLLKERKTDTIRVVGAVEEPGDYEIPRAGSDLLAAITAAGGLAKTAGQDIEIRHRSLADGGIAQTAHADGTVSPGQSVHVDLRQPMVGQSNDLSLRDGSVVMVKEHRPSTIYVHGLVPHDGEFDLPKDEPLRVTQAVALAGGRELEFADKVHVTRFVEGYPEPLVVEVSMKEAKSNRASNLVLLPGDVVSVEETPTTFTIDFLRNFFRVGFSSAIPGF